MKFLKTIFILTLALGVLSCSSDDDAGGGISSSIIGTWSATDVDIDGVLSTTVDGNTLNTSINGEPQNLNYQLTFNEDNTVTATGNFDVLFSFSFLGQNFNETFQDFDPVGTGTWAMSGNQLTITSGGESQVIIIDELSSSLLTLRLENEESINQDGQDFDAVFQSRMFLSRQ